MSSLIFFSDENQAIVATDTLATKPEGNPLLFCSKAIHLPHLHTVIAGTGQGGFPAQWTMQVNDRMVLKGIDNLDFHTQEGLRDLWEKYSSVHQMPAGSTTTVYQFGYCQETDKMLTFAYRSINDFESELMPYGLCAKPECSSPEGDCEIPKVFIEMMNEQREIQSVKSVEERIHIGGVINVLHLTKTGCSSYQLHQFSDYEKHKNQLFADYEK
jgi:hypothetical protein